MRHTGGKHETIQSDKGFSHNGNLIADMGRHTREKTYKCSLYDKAFSYNSNLKSHLMTPSGEKPFKCSQCDRISQKIVILLSIWGYTLGRSHTNVVNVTRLSQEKKVILNAIWGHTMGRNHTNAVNVTSLSHKIGILLPIWTHTLGRNHRNVVNVTTLSHIIVILKVPEDTYWGEIIQMQSMWQGFFRKSWSVKFFVEEDYVED